MRPKEYPQTPITHLTVFSSVQELDVFLVRKVKITLGFRALSGLYPSKTEHRQAQPSRTEHSRAQPSTAEWSRAEQNGDEPSTNQTESKISELLIQRFSNNIYHNIRQEDLTDTSCN